MQVPPAAMDVEPIVQLVWSVVRETLPLPIRAPAVLLAGVKAAVIDP